MKNSAIEWTHHTFNPWTGCTKVSPACTHCYAEAWAKRSGHVKWGDGAQRRRTSESYWREPLKWNREAARDGVRRRVFCASLADVFEDKPELRAWRADLLDLIQQTPALDWLLLTKRPENVQRLLDQAVYDADPDAPRLRGFESLPNVWLGTTVEDQMRAEQRIPHLLRVPATIRFLSCEPLLGPVDLINVRTSVPGFDGPGWALAVGIQWVICGGESGPCARPLAIEWAQSLRDQCRAAGVSFLFKQWGGRTPKAGGRLLDGREWNEYPQPDVLREVA